MPPGEVSWFFSGIVWRDSALVSREAFAIRADASQLLFGFVLDALGIFGAGAQFSLPKVLGVVLILIGGAIVVRY